MSSFLLMINRYCRVMKKVVRLFLILSVWTGLSFGQVTQGESSSPEYLVKAAFLYNFAKFVEWPAEAFVDDQTSITLCILGKDPFGDALDTIKNKIIRGRKLVIKRLRESKELEKCHILFISQSEKQDLAKVFETIKDWHVLTIGDMENFAQRGGIINLITVKNKIYFEINIDVAQHSDLKISSQLLKLATIIKN